MTQTEMLYILSNMRLSEFKAMTKALRCLMACGIQQLTALEIICNGFKDKQMRQAQEKQADGRFNRN